MLYQQKFFKLDKKLYIFKDISDKLKNTLLYSIGMDSCGR